MPYDPRYSRDMFGLVVSCELQETGNLRQVVAGTNPEETKVVN
jgi:hypothetical protein